METNRFQLELMKLASEEGFEDSEIYYAGGKSFEALIFEGEIAHYENSISSGVSFRGIFEGKMGYSYSEQIEMECIPFLVKEAKENAQIMENDEKEPLFEGEKSYSQIEGYHEALCNVTVLDQINAAKQMELSAKEYAEEIKTVNYCLTAYQEGEIAITNTKGLSVRFRDNYQTAYISAIAQMDDDIKTGSEFFAGTKFESFLPKKIGKAAAEKAVMYLGAKSIQSSIYSIVLSNLSAASLLSTFSVIFFGDNVQKGFSLLSNKLDSQIGSNILTIRDDGLLKDGMASIPFDSEGVGTQNKAVVENGILKTFLYNLKSAVKENKSSTGNGFKTSFQSSVQTACTNFYIQKGSKSLDDLFEKMGEGLYITELSGLHAGTNTVSGDFSLLAEGFWIEDGKIKYPIEQITVAGNFYTLLEQIYDIGNDLRFQLPGGSGVFGSPALLIEKMAVSGL